MNSCYVDKLRLLVCSWNSLLPRTTCIQVACLFAVTVSSAVAQTQDTVTTFTYDNLGNVKTVTRPLSRTTSYSYDALNRMTQQNVTVGSATLVTRQSYDGLDQVATVTDPRNLVTTYTVDGLGNRTQLTSPDTHGTGYTTDEAGNVLTVTDARGKTTAFQYDALNRLIQAQYQSGATSQFEYDGGPGGPAIEIGNLTRIADESGSTIFTHDMKGRVLTKTQTVSAGGTSAQLTLQYTYGSVGSAIGKLETITYPSGARVNYRYGADGRVNSVTVNPSDGSGGTSTLAEVPLLTDITYTPIGNVQSWRWGNSALPAYQRTYDLDGRLTSYPTDPGGTTRTVTYNAASLVTAYTHAGGPNPTQYDQTFAYDTADRLTSFSQGGVTTTYTYDANGNRTQQTGPSVTYTYDTTSNRLSSATFSTPRTYQYDASGNRIADGLYTYTYSDRGRLAQVGGAAQLSMYYNALGQRVLKAGTAQRIFYVYDEEGHTIGEYGQQHVDTVETVYLGDLPVAVLTPSMNFYVLADHIGAPLVLASPDGQIAWDWRSRDPFGNNVPRISTLLPGYDHRFPGQIADSETGLFYNYFRDYDPQIGRYVQSDPIGLKGGINTYAYVEGNSVSKIDPKGLQVPKGAIDLREVVNNMIPQSIIPERPSKEKLECMKKYIHDHYGATGDFIVPNFSAYSWIDNGSNMVDGGWKGNMESTVEHGGEKAGALGVLSQGGKFAQSAAVTSEALGMGGSASVGVFRVGTGMRAAAAGAEGVAEIAGVPLFYWATYANRQAAAACDCPQK